MKRRFLLLLPAVFVVLVLGVAACGGGDEESQGGAATETTGGGGGGETLELAADPGGAIKYDKTTLQASAGQVTIHFTNQSSLPHNVEVEGNGVEETSETISKSDTNLTLNLEPGEYEFYCTVDSHREQGMEGTLTVQ
jgi:plastocyanin